jgi:hypothetical protein
MCLATVRLSLDPGVGSVIPHYSLLLARAKPIVPLAHFHLAFSDVLAGVLGNGLLEFIELKAWKYRSEGQLYSNVMFVRQETLVHR